MGYYVPEGILFLLPAWVLYGRAQREGGARFKAKCVALFKSSPERAFAANFDQEFEAWATIGPKGKVEALPHEMVQEHPKPAGKLAPISTPARPTRLLLEIILQSDLPNKAAMIEAYKHALVTTFNLDIPPAEIAGMKGEEIITRLVKALREQAWRRNPVGFLLRI